MKRKKYALLLTLIASLFALNIKVFAYEYESYSVGDKISYNNMDFYVIKESASDEDYITLLKAEPLKSDEMKDLVEATEIADKISLTETYLRTAYVYNDMCGSIENSYDTSGCTTDYSLSSVKQLVDIWGKATLTESDLKEDNLGYKMRLITFDELINNIGFEEKNFCPTECYNYAAPNEREWIYNATSSYWTMSGYEDSNLLVYTVGSKLSQSEVTRDSIVVPVINLSKSANFEVIKKVNEINYDDLKIGDIVTYNGIKFYVVEDSGSNKSYVKLLKATPISYEDVLKYYDGDVLDKDGYGAVEYYKSETCIDAADPAVNTSAERCNFITDSCTTNYDESFIESIINEWENANFKESDLSKIDGYSARLLSINDLVDTFDYEFVKTSYGLSYYANENPLTWLHKYDTWLMGYSDDTNTKASYMDGSRVSFNRVFSYACEGTSGGIHTIRPVIYLNKNVLTKLDGNASDENIKNEIVSIPDTLMNNPVIIIIVGIILIIISVLTFVLIKKRKNIVTNKDN